MIFNIDHIMIAPALMKANGYSTEEAINEILCLL